MSATPQNFIEKIFQIPFTLKPLSYSAFSRLIGGLFEPRPNNTPIIDSPGNKKNTTKDGVKSPKVEIKQDTPVEARKEFVLTDEQGRMLVSDEGHILVTESNEQEDIDFDEIGKSLEVKPWESEFAEKLFNFIKTPRSAKRFVNIYRLLKVSVSPAEMETFEGLVYRPGEFQLPMLLLAIVVGCNDVAPEILTFFYQNAISGNTISQSLDEARMNSNKAKAIASLNKSLQQLVDQQWFPDDPKLLLKWIPEVSRFSFQPIALD